VGLAFGGPHPSALGGALLAAALLVSATALFSLMPIVQTRLAVAAGAAAPLALALNGSANFLGQAGGAVAGGAAIALAGLPWAPLTGAVAAGLGAVVLAAAARPARVAQPTLAA
jgi:DHA1 family inner membrane transport protein